MDSPQTNAGYGIKITINWNSPTKIIKEKFFGDTGSDSYFRAIYENGLSAKSAGILDKQSTFGNNEELTPAFT